MRRIPMWILGSLIASQSSFASTYEHIKPYLDFDKNYEEEKHKVHSQYLDVSVEDYRFPDGKQKVKFEKALAILEEVLNSESFRKKVLSYKNSSGNREYQKNYLWNDKGNRLTNEDVYNILMSANEKMIPDTLGQMNIYATLKRCGWFQQRVSIWCRKVIGSTAPSKSPWMTLNWKFYKNYEVHQMVSNIVHEWIHLLGFLHGKKNMREEVPYVVGAIAGRVAKEILEKEEND